MSSAYRLTAYGEHFSRLLVTELCKGTLADLVKGRFNSSPLDWNNWRIVRQIAMGLWFLHDSKVVHRDLNPRNILFIIDDRNRPVMKLADFGCSRTLQDGESRHVLSKTRDASYYTILRPFGTDGWLAPEVLNARKEDDPFYTYEGDIFPLGLIIGFTLSGGLHPFDVDPPNDEETNEEKIQRIKKRNERIKNEEPMTLAVDQLKDDDQIAFDLIKSMLSPNPDERPSAAKVLRHEYLQIRRDPQVC